MTLLTKPAAIIVDMDGTLSDCEWRRHHVTGDKKYYDEFHAGCGEDPLHNHIGVIVNRLHGLYKVLIVTGRPEKYREKTSRWLDRNYIHWDALFMRPDGDNRQDFVLKEDILDRNILPNWSPLMAFDDRDSMVQLWRRRNIPCLQVAPGDF